MLLSKLVNFFKKEKKREDSFINVFEKNDTILSSMPKRMYQNIPLYSKQEMKEAIIDKYEDNRVDCLYRQVLNGYAGVYNEEWFVGKNEKGQLIKRKGVLPYSTPEENLKYKNKIMEVQKKALYGKDIKEEIFCKFTYDKVNQDIYSLHTNLVNEYVEGCIINDSGMYGGIHFVPLNHIENCLDAKHTFYGDKIAIIVPIEDEVYYEYMENTFVGKRVFVSDVMYLKDMETWMKLVEMSDSIKNRKGQIVEYLSKLEGKLGDERFKDCKEYLLKL